MWGLYCWGDLNIYLILFWALFENKNQSCSKAWWLWWSAFEWELAIFFNPSRPIPKNIVRERYFSEIEFRKYIHCSLLYLMYQIYKLGRNASATLSLLSLGSERKVKCYNKYFFNGYVFHSEEYGQSRKT
jgi:hypothetical protein